MNVSRVSLSAALLVAVSGCHSNDEAPPPPAPVVSVDDSPPQGTASPAPGRRSLLEGAQLPTSAVNLVTDPGFLLTAQQAGASAFLAISEDGEGLVTLETMIDSRSPAGFGGRVARVEPPRGTDTSSKPVIVLTSLLGGAGPFTAQIWVSRSTPKGAPLPVTNDDAGVTASLANGSPEGDAVDLRPVDGAAREVAGRTWVLLRGVFDKPLPYGGFLVIRTGSGGGHFLLAAPEVLADPLVAGGARTMSRAGRSPSRHQTTAEAAAIRAYRRIRPRLAPPAPPQTAPRRPFG